MCKHGCQTTKPAIEIFFILAPGISVTSVVTVVI